MPRATVIAVVTVSAALICGVASAQGKSGNPPGGGKGKGHQPGGGSGPPAPTATTPSPATASFNSWIDDATVPAPGTAWFALSVGEWNSDAGRDIEAPVPAVVAGLAPHLSVGANLPIDTFQASTGTTSGVGDVSLFAKLGLVDPASHPVGAAVIPVIQVSPSATGSGRDVSWALPVSLEVRRAHGRIYGTGGYFSSGSIFASGAAELRVARRVALTGILGHTYAVDASTVPVGQSRHRTDISGSLALIASPRAIVFAAIGHAYSGNATADGGPWIAAGIVIRNR